MGITDYGNYVTVSGMVQKTDPAFQTSELDLNQTVHVLRRVFPIGGIETFVLGTQPRTIGREPPENGIMIDDSEASRSHAMVEIGGKGYRIRDLGSTNGLFVNAERVQAQSLKMNDVIRVGRSLFVYTSSALGHSGFLDAASSETSFSRLSVESLAQKAAASSLPILINGPTGAGKEMLAQAVHRWSGRGGPFLPINCGAVAGELIASELFGHRKGAFSGASDHRAGLFQTAHDGTLFLDEIAELPLSVQASLLRVCESNEVRPVGADRNIKVNVRLLSATHSDLDARVEAGLFRADLLARLRGVTLHLPPLSERKDEILSLFDRFVHGRSFGLTVATRLLTCVWSDNVRGLKRAAEHALLFSDEAEQILPNHLPSFLVTQAPQASSPVEKEVKLDETRLEQLLIETRGNVAEVGRRLGVHRQQVYRWITRAKLSPADYRDL